MAKAMAKAAMARTGKKCTCNLAYMVVAWILFAIGLYFLAGGFVGQFTGSSSAGFVLFAYFVGFVILTLGKMAKWKSHGTCPVHGGKV